MARRRWLVEELAKPAAAPTFAVAIVASPMVAAAPVPLVVLRRLTSAHAKARVRALQDLVQFTPIQPDTATLRAIVDLDTIAFRQCQCRSVNWAVHRYLHTSPYQEVGDSCICDHLFI